MNCSRVGAGSPPHPPIAITDVPDAISSAAADCDPFVAADHAVCVAASRAARSPLVASSPIQPPTANASSSLCAATACCAVRCTELTALGTAPLFGVIAVAMENATVPAAAPAAPTRAPAADHRRLPISAAAIPTTLRAVISVGTQVGPKWLRFNRFTDHQPASPSMTASAMRPSQPDRMRHAHVVPNPTNAATAGASATV